MQTTGKKEKRVRRHARVRAKVVGTATRPRLSVFRSNRSLVVQLINDEKGETLAFQTSKGMSGTPKEQARAVGKAIAEDAKKQKIERAVFDRGGFQYTGRVQEVAEGAREAGLIL